MNCGTEAQKQRFIPRILGADDIWCQGYSEPGAGSDLAGLSTRAADMGDYFLVNGQKVWTSGAQYADWMFMLARTDPEAPKHRGISYPTDRHEKRRDYCAPAGPDERALAFQRSVFRQRAGA
jgi:alkylation response protein AidB-like acyl-CoA dehydrogenase